MEPFLIEINILIDSDNQRYNRHLISVYKIIAVNHWPSSTNATLTLEGGIIINISIEEFERLRKYYRINEGYSNVRTNTES